MAKQRKVWMALGAMAALSVGTVAVAPATGWIVRQQTMALESLLLPQSLVQSRLGARDTARRAETARQNPGDVNLQIGYAGENLAALQALEPRDGDSPTLQAAILRNLSRERMDLKGRDADAAVLSTPASKPVVDHDTLTPETAQLWEQAATNGERVDPTNAFFPYMHAIGLFAAHRDDEACAEIVRAGTLPHYNDYTRDVTEGEWRLADSANRMESGSMAKVAIQAAMLLPHYAVMRQAARLAAVHAVALEQAGQAEQGFVVRRGLERTGARMRTDSSWIIGSLVGQAIGAISWSRPGGADPLPHDNRQDNEQRSALLRQRYEAYLKSIGHPEEVAWIEHDTAARAVIKQSVERGLELGPFGMQNMIRIMSFWGASSTLLCNLFFVLVLGGIAALCLRTQTIREDRPLKPVVRAIVSVVVLGCTLYIANAATQTLGAYATTAASLTGNQPAAAATPDSGISIASLVSLLLLLQVPVVMTIVFAIRSRRRGVPAGAGIVRGFAGAALPTAAILALLYVPAIVATGQLESRMLRLMQETAQNEGAACARWTGHPWPSFGPENAK